MRCRKFAPIDTSPLFFKEMPIGEDDGLLQREGEFSSFIQSSSGITQNL